MKIRDLIFYKVSCTAYKMRYNGLRTDTTDQELP
jgi:hypothetical protein